MFIVVTDGYPAHSGDSFCSSDISLDDSTNLEQLDEATSDTLSLHNLELGHGGGGGPGGCGPQHDAITVAAAGGHPAQPLANPIDKLYLMQNSYFSSEQ